MTRAIYARTMSLPELEAVTAAYIAVRDLAAFSGSPLFVDALTLRDRLHDAIVSELKTLPDRLFVSRRTEFRFIVDGGGDLNILPSVKAIPVRKPEKLLGNPHSAVDKNPRRSAHS